MRETLVKALRLSGEKLLEYFDRPLETKQKESQSSIVTEADIESDAIITGLIRQKFPDHNLISEEGGFLNNFSEYTWVIDPLDGTSNFASGIPWFGILIALFRKNQPVMGGAYLPVQDKLYFAEPGKGCFRNDVPLRSAKNMALKDSLIAFSVDFTEDENFLARGLELYRFIVKNSRNIRSTNSLVDFIYVAEENFGGCINLYTKVWDISALGLIINEAGGIMTHISGIPIRFEINDKLIYKNFPVVAGSGRVTAALREMLAHTFNRE